ncbi:MAG TPA: glycosyltransferase, partial [Oscillospiraceae bacterium]|nr:glycosyltransferase [Oscillospiraceae bacterium]
MKITIFIPGLVLGGTERITCNLANHLVDCGNTVEILTLFSVEKPAYLLKKDVNIICLLSDDEKETNKIKKVIKHVIRYFHLISYTMHSNTERYLVMLPLPVIMLLSLKNITVKVPVIFSERSDPHHSFGASRILNFLSKWLLRKADGAIFQTESASSYYHDVCKCSHLVIVNPLSEALITEAKRDKADDPEEKAIITVGRLSKVKNLSLILNAFSSIHTTYPEYVLKLIGDGNERKNLEELTRKLQITDSVIFCGTLNDYSDIYRKGNIFVLCSDYEGMPNALMEAMAMGLPCVSSDCPCG